MFETRLMLLLGSLLVGNADNMAIRDSRASTVRRYTSNH